MVEPRHVTLTGIVDDRLAGALRGCVDGVLDLHESPTTPTPVADPTPVIDELIECVTAVAPVVRPELDVDHFVVGGVTATLGRSSSGAHRDVDVGVESLGSPYLGFVGNLGTESETAGPDDQPGDAHDARPGVVTVRLLDDDWTEVDLVVGAVVVFPADCHHEVVRPRPCGDELNYVVSGFVTGASLSGDGIDLDDAVRQRLQQHYLPRLSASGYEIHPIPSPIHEMLTALLEIRRDRATTECSEPFRPTGDADFIEVGDLGDDLMRWMQPMHEEFAGVPLTPSNIYGIRSYREGNTLNMHLDRPEALIASSILQIDQDVDEPWPLVVEVDGRQREIVLESGQMLFYEGATTLHGRPSPLVGRSFANLFVHYRPVDWPWDAKRIARQALVDGFVDVFGRPTDTFEELLPT